LIEQTKTNKNITICPKLTLFNEYIYYTLLNKKEIGRGAHSLGGGHDLRNRGTLPT
jgi:hypothetical protein